MTGERSRDQTPKFQVEPRPDTQFAWIRTRMSTERTLMSWIRTGVSLIGFGFTIFQFFQRLDQMPGGLPATRAMAPWLLGLGLIGTGTIAVIIATWQYRSVNHYLWGKQFEPVIGFSDAPIHSPTFGIAVFLAVIGALAFVAVLLRLA